MQFTLGSTCLKLLLNWIFFTMSSDYEHCYLFVYNLSELFAIVQMEQQILRTVIRALQFLWEFCFVAALLLQLWYESHTLP